MTNSIYFFRCRDCGKEKDLPIRVHSALNGQPDDFVFDNYNGGVKFKYDTVIGQFVPVCEECWIKWDNMLVLSEGLRKLGFSLNKISESLSEVGKLKDDFNKLMDLIRSERGLG